MPGRKFFVGGNWKMNTTKATIPNIICPLTEDLAKKAEIVLCVPSTYLDFVKQKVPCGISVASQNCLHECKGPFTGEISPQMALDCGATWTLVGHSERRRLFNVSDECVAKKVCLDLSLGLKVIVCIGETKEERCRGETNCVITKQLQAFLPSIDSCKWDHVVIAYEPVWAIGTGDVATPCQAQEVHAFIRELLKCKVSENVSNCTRIIYGGSVNAENASALIKEKDIDGFLVGGASLTEDFVKIISACSCGC